MEGLHLLGGLDLDKVDGLGQAGLRSELARVQNAAAGGDDLATTAVDGVSVHHHIAHLKTHPQISVFHPFTVYCFQTYTILANLQ